VGDRSPTDEGSSSAPDRAILLLMANEKAPECWSAPADLPSEVQITVMVVSRAGDRPLRERLASIGVVACARAIAAMPLAVAALGATVAGALHGTRTGVRGSARADQAHGAGAAGVAAAYGYPFRCLRIISASNPAYGRAEVDRRGECARYHGYVNASFDRIDGDWRLVLDEGPTVRAQ
jgi:hypothetical protein